MIFINFDTRQVLNYFIFFVNNMLHDKNSQRQERSEREEENIQNYGNEEKLFFFRLSRFYTYIREEEETRVSVKWENEVCCHHILDMFIR